MYCYQSGSQPLNRGYIQDCIREEESPRSAPSLHILLADRTADNMNYIFALAMSDVSPSPKWTLTDRALSSYMELQRVSLSIASDAQLTDGELLERARRHLQVFDNPEFAEYNRPPWAASFPMFALEPSKAQAVTAGRFFEAMMQTAHDLDLGDSRRFPPCGDLCMRSPA